MFLFLFFWIGCSNPLEECRVACDLPIKECKEYWNSLGEEDAKESGWKSKKEMIEATAWTCKGKMETERKECLEDCVLRHGK